MENEPESDQTSTASRMNTAVLGVCVFAVGAMIALVGQKQEQCGCLSTHTLRTWPITRPSAESSPEQSNQASLPRLLDLGATTCVPCRKMTPILDELKTEYEGKLDVQFVDVWQIPGIGDQYAVQAIPTQIFFDASGKELYRHQGFLAKEEILQKWGELGVDLTK